MNGAHLTGGQAHSVRGTVTTVSVKHSSVVNTRTVYVSPAIVAGFASPEAITLPTTSPVVGRLLAKSAVDAEKELPGLILKLRPATTVLLNTSWALLSAVAAVLLQVAAMALTDSGAGPGIS